MVNLQKTFSYFNQGMKPVVYSLKEGKGWKMEGYNISYNRNDLLKVNFWVFRLKIVRKNKNIVFCLLLLIRNMLMILLLLLLDFPILILICLNFWISFKGKLRKRVTFIIGDSQLQKQYQGTIAHL